MATLHITDLEAAINYWRARTPSPDGIALAPPLAALAEVYAQLVYRRQDEAEESSLSLAARQAWEAWYATDTPCIAICSTSQGDDRCKGCGRSFAEVRHWPAMGALEKRAVWRRIAHEGTAWRFHRCAERAAENLAAGAGAAGAGPLRAPQATSAPGPRPVPGHVPRWSPGCSG